MAMPPLDVSQIQGWEEMFHKNPGHPGENSRMWAKVVVVENRGKTGENSGTATHENTETSGKFRVFFGDHPGRKIQEIEILKKSRKIRTNPRTRKMPPKKAPSICTPHAFRMSLARFEDS